MSNYVQIISNHVNRIVNNCNFVLILRNYVQILCKHVEITVINCKYLQIFTNYVQILSNDVQITSTHVNITVNNYSYVQLSTLSFDARKSPYYVPAQRGRPRVSERAKFHSLPAPTNFTLLPQQWATKARYTP